MRGLRRNAEILMYDGTIKKAGEIIIGDILMGDDSTERIVQDVFRSREVFYEVEFTKNVDSYFAPIDSILCMKNNTSPKLVTTKEKYPRYRVYYFENIITQKDGYILNQLKGKKPSYFFRYGKEEQFKKANEVLYIRFKEYHEGFPLHELEIVDCMIKSKSFYEANVLYTTGVEFNNPLKQEISPYLLGSWLGDGSSKDPSITNIDPELIQFLYDEAERMGLEIYRGHDTEHGRGSMHYRLKSNGKVGANKFVNFLKLYHLWGNKHIPYHYKVNTRKNRLLVLAGLIDTDGHYNIECNYYTIVQKNELLSNDIVFLIRSLGYWCHIKPYVGGCYYKEKWKPGIYYSMSFGGENLTDIPVLLPRKMAIPKTKIRNNPMHYGIKTITKYDKRTCYGFELSGNHRFILADFKVVHD